MAWVAIGGSVIGAVAGGVVNHALNKGGGSGGGSSGSGSPAAVADPFGDQRAQYQPQLASLIGKDPSQGTNNAQLQGMAKTGAGSSASDKMNAMLASDGGNNFLSNDPSYDFRLRQGSENLNRSMASKGMLGSGNRMAELENYGQNLASQEYAAQYQRMAQASGINAGLQQQQFNQLNTLDTNQLNNYQNQFSRLAQLSGANSGQPGQAGQLLAGQQAGSSAMWGKIGTSVWDHFAGDGTGNGTPRSEWDPNQVPDTGDVGPPAPSYDTSLFA